MDSLLINKCFGHTLLEKKHFLKDCHHPGRSFCAHDPSLGCEAHVQSISVCIWGVPVHLTYSLILCTQITRRRVDVSGDSSVKSPCWLQVLNLWPSDSDLLWFAAIILLTAVGHLLFELRDNAFDLVSPGNCMYLLVGTNDYSCPDVTFQILKLQIKSWTAQVIFSKSFSVPTLTSIPSIS